MYLKNVYRILHLRKKSTKPVYQLIGHFVVTSLTGFDKDQTEADIEEKKACLRKGNTTLITQLYEECQFCSKGCWVMNYLACLVSPEFCLFSWLPHRHSYASLYSWYCFNFPIHNYSHLHVCPCYTWRWLVCMQSDCTSRHRGSSSWSTVPTSFPNITSN